MRIIALQLTETRLRVAYRWDASLGTTPRLLIDRAPVSLAELRQIIERDFFGEPMTPDTYQIITHVEADLDAMRGAFPGFTLTVLDAEARSALSGWLDPATDPALRDVLAMACWRASPLDFRALIGWLADQVTTNDEAQHELAAIATATRIVLIGGSARALADTTKALIGSPLSVPAIPSASILQQAIYRGLPLTVLDGRTSLDLQIHNALNILIMSIASDPGLGADDLVTLRSVARAILVVVNTHADPADFAQMVDYVRTQIGVIALVSDLGVLAETVNPLIESVIRHTLGNWATRWLTADRDIRRVRAAFRGFRL